MFHFLVNSMSTSIFKLREDQKNKSVHCLIEQKRVRGYLLLLMFSRFYRVYFQGNL